MNLTPLSSILSARHRAGTGVNFEVPQDWLQGRTTFGGLVSAFAVQAMRDVAARGWPAAVKLRALQTNFIAPVAEGPVDVTVQVLREGKSVRQVQATVMQRNEICALVVGVFGSDRETVIPRLEPQRPPVPKDHGEFKSPTPASSVSWALELRPLPADEALDGWWRADNQAIAAAGGYVNQQSMLWAPSGALAALAYQVVTVYG